MTAPGNIEVLAQGFRMSDRRRAAVEQATSVAALPVRDTQVAGAVAAMDSGQIDSDAAAYVPAKKPEVSYDLRPLREVWGEFMLQHAQAREAGHWLKAFKTLVPPVVGEATLLQMGDRPVARYRRDGKLNLTLLAQEQPQVVAQFTRIMAEEKFDEAAFKEKMPAMHAAYRGRSLRLVTVGNAPFVLPS